MAVYKGTQVIAQENDNIYPNLEVGVMTADNVNSQTERANFLQATSAVKIPINCPSIVPGSIWICCV